MQDVLGSEAGRPSSSRQLPAAGLEGAETPVDEKQQKSAETAVDEKQQKSV